MELLQQSPTADGGFAECLRCSRRPCQLPVTFVSAIAASVCCSSCCCWWCMCVSCQWLILHVHINDV